MEEVVNSSVWETRVNICKKCPIYSNGICSRTLFVNPKTGDISPRNKTGYYKGCGCKIMLKTKLKSEKCPAGKW